MSEEMDADQVLKALDAALQNQGRSILTMSLLAGTLRGVGGAAVKQNLRQFVLAELEDTYLLVEKMSALGGTPRMQIDFLWHASNQQEPLA